MAEALAKKKRVRAGHRGVSKKLILKVQEKLAEDAIENEWILRSIDSLKEKRENLRKLNEEMLDLLANDDTADIETEIAESDDFSAEITEVIIKLEGLRDMYKQKSVVPQQSTNLNDSVSSTTTSASTSGQKACRVKLPKLELAKFDGTVYRWQEFWDSFESAIDQNDELSQVDKFSYLRGLLEGPARSTIAGFSLTSANYGNAVALLKSRFGNDSVIQRAHIKELMGVQPIYSERDIGRLRKLYDHCETHCRGLKALGVDESTYEAIVVPAIMEKLPESFRLTITRGNDFFAWKMKEMLKAFLTELELKEQHLAMSTTREGGKQTESRGPQRDRKGFTAKPFTTTALLAHKESKNIKNNCAYCLKDHASEDCKEVQDTKIRKTIVFKYARCFKCLTKGHRAKDCKFDVKCKACGGDHHISLCEGKNENQKTSVSESVKESVSATYVATECDSSEIAMNVKVEKIALQTAIALVRGEREGKVRVMFDSGSQKTFVTPRVVNSLGLKVVGNKWLAISTFGGDKGKPQLREVVEMFVMPVGGGGEGLKVHACVVPEISSVTRDNLEVVKGEYTHLKDLWLSDVGCGKVDDKIELLIGADYLWEFQTGRTKRGNSGDPVAIETRLGWVLSGPLKCPDTRDAENVACTVKADCVTSLEGELSKLWDFETLGIKTDDEVHEALKDDIVFNGERYQVSLPWKEGHPKLCTNYRNSLNRLKGQLNKLRSDPNILDEYNKVIKQQEEVGIIERVNNLDFADKIHYLPHHAVIRRDAKTTKVRVVYDASSKDAKGGVSLNDCLHVGPALAPLLYNVLLRFRSKKIALVADIEKAFLNVEVNPRDRDSLRFLWTDDVNSETVKPVVYRFNRVVFGVNCSPFLLNATLHHHLEGFKEKDPEFTNKMQKSFYVDDLVTGEQTKERSLETFRKAKSRLAAGGFRLRKWVSNDKELLDQISIYEGIDDVENKTGEMPTYAKTALGGGDECSSQKVLGLKWDLNMDKFVINLRDVSDRASSKPVTKRNVLSAIAGLYDPLGVVSPVGVSMRMFFQDLCKEGLGWDEELDPGQTKKWREWMDDFADVKEVRVPRCVYNGDNSLKCTLHGFADASYKGYCAVVYLVCEFKEGTRVELLTSKTRVAPLKEQTIPRLELMGARVLAQLMHTVTNALKGELEIEETFLWLDSTTALCWIENRGEWKQFVRHRVNEILRLTKKDQWRHCPGKENPADLGSRGLMAGKLVASNLWWHGPSWLVGPKEGWPFHASEVDVTPEAMEEIKTTTLSVNSTQSTDLENVVDVSKYNTFEKLVRVTAWVRRFVQNAKARSQEKRTVGKLKVEELLQAERKLISAVQAKMKGNDNYKQLECELRLVERDGILRCRGRMCNADLDDEAREPILLPRGHRLTDLIILNCHIRVHHSGLRATLAELRSKYWIPRGRQSVKAMLNRCNVCKRHEGKPYSEPPTADLPQFRVRQEEPFSKIGVDFAGPLYAKGAKGSMNKVYIVLFTCCVTRAIHLDLVDSLDAKTFLMSLRRFASRRGCPTLIVSDNAKTFQSVSKSIKGIFESEDVLAYCDRNRIEWRFNLPKAPWWGGFFERMVGTVKRCLRKVLGTARLRYDELLTCLVEIEGTINSRPLTYEYDEAGIEFLTPSHLLFGRRLTSLPDESGRTEEEDEVGSIVKRYRYMSRKRIHFWNRWRKEYLADLREYHKISKGSTVRKAQVGDVVLVHEDGVKRNKWKVGKVEEIIKGSDGNIRGARVRVITNRKPVIISRPVQRLYPFEVQNEVNNQNPLGGMDTNGQMGIGNLNGPLRGANRAPRRAAAIDSEWRTRAALNE